jgi:hypothetical protein
VNADFVIVSYECNFWALAALDALIDSLEDSELRPDVWVVHNLKTNHQIEHFRAHARRPAWPGALNHLTAYEGVFQQIVNFGEHTRDALHHTIARHGLVLNWLIKYRLPEGRYVFIDHDCLVRKGFARALAHLKPELEDKIFAFARHDADPKSLTAPMFACDVAAVRPLVAGLPDAGWAGTIACHERHLLEGGGERFYTKAEFERVITRPNFDDTMHNVVRHLLARDLELVDRLAAVRWPECDHVWHSATKHLRRAQIGLIREWIAQRFRPEYFVADLGVSTQLNELLVQLDECGLAEEFRRRFLRTGREEGSDACN